MLDQRSKDLRNLIIRGLLGGGRGHVGAAFSLVEILRVLYDDVIGEGDRVILSKGHGCLAQYALLVDKGMIDAKELDTFCRAGAMLGGHPEHHIPGVHVSTGSLGHGLSLGIGFALADRTHRVFVIMGDGEINEGSVWEAALCAGKHHLSNLTVIVDRNWRQSYGPTEEVQPLGRVPDLFYPFGFYTQDVSGHDVDALLKAFRESDPRQPSAFTCHTIKGKGVPECEHHPFWHHKDVFTAEDGARLTAALDA